MKNDYLSIRVKNREYATDCVLVYTHWTYLHGYLEEDLGYDIFEVTDPNSIAVDTEIIANTKVFFTILKKVIKQATFSRIYITSLIDLLKSSNIYFAAFLDLYIAL